MTLLISSSLWKQMPWGGRGFKENSRGYDSSSVVLWTIITALTASLSWVSQVKRLEDGFSLAFSLFLFCLYSNFDYLNEENTERDVTSEMWPFCFAFPVIWVRMSKCPMGPANPTEVTWVCIMQPSTICRRPGWLLGKERLAARRYGWAMGCRSKSRDSMRQCGGPQNTVQRTHMGVPSKERAFRGRPRKGMSSAC